MKTKIIYVCFSILLMTQSSLRASNLGDSISKYEKEEKIIDKYYSYISLTPINRANYIKKNLINFNASLAYSLLLDMTMLSCIEEQPMFFDINETDQKIVDINEEKFDKLFELWKTGIKKKNFLFIARTDNQLLIGSESKLSSPYEYVKNYLSNDIKNRINYLEYYLNSIDTRLIILFEKDIDTILGVKTKKIIKNGKVNIKTYYKVKEIWLKQLS